VVKPESRPESHGGLAVLAKTLLVPAAYSVVYFAVVIIYFTYAAEFLSRDAIPGAAIPVLYAVIGLTGVTGLATASIARRVGSAKVGALCLIFISAALALLGLAGDSFVAIAGSACIFGVGYMTGSAVIAVWTAELVPDRAGAAFTGCLVVGAFSSVVAPAVAGVAIPSVGLGTLLLLSAAASLLSGVALMLYELSRRASVEETRP
jgi:predicted MFS family arabinose efflux permease